MPLRKVPAGNTTVHPPAALAAVMAALMAVAFSSLVGVAP